MMTTTPGTQAPGATAQGTTAPGTTVVGPRKLALLRRIAEAEIGVDRVLETPFGPRRVTYCDWTASGRALSFVEDFVRDEVLPFYANTHTEASGTGLATTRLREDARRAVRDGVGGDDSTAVIFCGSGATAAVTTMVAVLGLRLPSALDDRYGFGATVPQAERPVVLVGPFEHHSNELPWRESIADVVVVPQDAEGHVDLAALEAALVAHADRELVIGSFSAASNVTGILTDTDAVTSLLHRYGALAFWDYAAAAPYVDVVMVPPPGADPSTAKDAVFLSPHKFVGGPGTPGVLAVRKALLRNRVPTVPGGGTVEYVNPDEHVYLADPEHREEGGTPSIVGAVRAGLVFQLKAAVGTDVIHAREAELLRRARDRWAREPAIEILGNPAADRLSILSFTVTTAGTAHPLAEGGRRGRALHHGFVVALLNDLFGIQARGGCSCAGPYGHRLLGIDLERSHAFQREIHRGCEGVKPGWVRLSLAYFMPDEVADYVVEAVALAAREGWKLLPQYRFDPRTGLWRHRSGPVGPGLRLAMLTYDDDGVLHFPRRSGRAGVEALRHQLDEARALLAAADPAPHVQATAAPGCPQDFFDLLWFDLPEECLA